MRERVEKRMVRRMGRRVGRKMAAIIVMRMEKKPVVIQL